MSVNWRNTMAVAALAPTLLAGAAFATTELVMVEEAGCVWCARWGSEIAPIYAKTEEGRIAPLRRIALRAPSPPDLSFDAPLRITPTFVLVDDGEEVARLEGYPGEDFFWGLLGAMIDKLPNESEDD